VKTEPLPLQYKSLTIALVMVITSSMPSFRLKHAWRKMSSQRPQLQHI